MKRLSACGSALLLLLLPGCATLDRPNPKPGGGAGQAVAETQRFSLYSDPWINLHHFLYQWAFAAKPEGGPQTHVPVVEVPERDELPQLTAGERQIWNSAVDYYQQEIISRSLVLDADLIAAKERLAQASTTGGASLAGLPPRWREVLEGAMRVYEKHWWPRHDRTNRAWIQSLTPKLQTYEIRLTTGMTRAFGGTLPAQKVRLDAAAYSDWSGAYTTPKPNHTVIASGNPAFQGFDALEITIHEFSHLDELENPLRDLLARAFAQGHAKPPRDLWHAFIFYTACDLTREALGTQGIKDYQCVADRVGLLGRNPHWRPYWQSFEAYWKPFLEGNDNDREKAAGEVARGLLQNAAR